MGITRYNYRGGKGVLDVFSDGRRYAYYKGPWFEEMIVRIDTDDSTGMIAPYGVEWDEIEEPGREVTVQLEGNLNMDDSVYATWALALWFEMFFWPQINTAHQNSLALSRDEQICRLESALISWWVDPSIANTLAVNLIDNNVKPKFTEIGIQLPPINFIRLALGQ